MNDRTPFLMFGRRFHDTLRSTIRNGNGSDPIKWNHEKPIYAHYACGMYLSGCLSYLEGTYGRTPWKNSNHTNSSLDSFIDTSPEKQRNNFLNAGVSETGFEALVCLRNAFIHNSCDLSENRDNESLSKVVDANIPGVNLEGSVFTLLSNNNEDFMSYVRMSFVAVAQYHGGG